MPTTSHRTRFLDQRIPSLYAGQYQLSVEQNIDTVAALATRQQDFAVRGPRFSLGGSEIHGCYPVPGAAGDYGQILPHVTLDAAGLPWARLLGGFGDGIAWVALLVFREGELACDPGAVGEVDISTVRQLLDGAAGDEVPPAISDASLLEGEAEMACRTIGVPAELFTAICPTAAELALLSHVREGGPADADHVRGSDPEPQLDDINAVIVANRFPGAAGGWHVAHLVSLEGFAEYVGGAPVPSAGVRLVSLHNWSFHSTDVPGMSFGEIVSSLAAAPDLALRVPLADDADADVKAIERLRGGATVLAQRLESGERSISFYRGPLTAEPAQPLPRIRRAESGGEALTYLEQWGIFDTGYASAFSLGRTLALSDAPFRNKLLDFRKAARNAARNISAHPDLIAGRSVSAAAAAVRGNGARAAFDELLTSQLAGVLGRSGAALASAPVRPAVQAPRTAALSAPALRAAIAQEQTQAVLRAATATELDPVVEWLNRLTRLEMLPFDHLVPSPRMLPPESIRFCYIDDGWTSAAVDGALSVGVGHALDSDLNSLPSAVAPPPACGVLIRSVLVPGWPRTIYTAFHGDQEIAPGRIATFGNDILFLLYPVIVDTFTIAEPPQGLYFGVGDTGTIELRHLTGEIGASMRDFPESGGFGQFLRPAEDVLDLENSLLPALAAEHQLPALSPAQFALQMVRAPQLQTFDRP